MVKEINYKLEKNEIAERLEAMIKDEFICVTERKGNFITITFIDGQKFEISVEAPLL